MLLFSAQIEAINAVVLQVGVIHFVLWMAKFLMRSYDVTNENAAMNYIDGLVLAIPSENKAAYIKHSCIVAEMFKEYGALSVVECWGDDIPEGKITSFSMAVKCKENETVCFSWISWPSKRVRDKAMKLVVDDPRMEPENTVVPFDGKRIIFGGFEVIVNR